MQENSNDELTLESLNKRVIALEIQLEKMKPETEFDKLKKLLHSSEWPAAIKPELICDVSSDQDKEDRAEGILDIIIGMKLQNLSFLDFGCGEGHVIKHALKQNAKLAVGYDVKEHEEWKGKEWENSICTTNWNVVLKNGPYDIILLYDVIDHVNNQTEELNKIKSVCNANTKIFIRCHPFTSRHGTHLYQQLNKAFIQLVFNDEEVKTLGLKPLQTNKIYTPVLHYNKLFADNGFKLIKPTDVTKEPIDNFFLNNPLIRARIKSNPTMQGTSKDFPAQLENQFLDYVLQVK